MKEKKFDERDLLKFAVTMQLTDEGTEEGIRNIFNSIEKSYEEDSEDDIYIKKMRYAYSVLDTMCAIVDYKDLEANRDNILLLSDQLRETADLLDTLVVR